MESGAVGMETGAAPLDPRGKPVTMACLRRRAWAQSKESIWQESKPEHCGPQGPEQSQSNGETQRPSEEPGQVPSKITSWLSECRTPLGASLDDQSASPSRGAPRNGCSFEDDLSLGAEANHLQSSNNKVESCFGCVADQKRSQYKERGRSMNSTGSGKSSTVSSVSDVLEQSEEQPADILLTLRVSELLDLYEEDPEEILLNLGFGREEPDLSSKIPSRFFNNNSSARGIDIKVYLSAQLQRTELENPNYALTSRFRQIEVLTTVANEFFQLYSQVSGQPVQCIDSKDQGGEAGETEEGREKLSPLKRNNSAVNVAKLLKRTITKHNLLASAPELPETQTPNQQTQLNGHSEHAHINGHAGPEQDGSRTDSDHQMETVSQKPIRKKDNFSLATVTEETNGDVELTLDSPDQTSTGPEHHSESADLQRTEEEEEEEEEGSQVVKEENLTSTPEKAPPTLVPPQLAQLRTENADSFDMEEIQSNEDEALPSRTSRSSDLLRTVSQQSDSSGFAEEPSVDCNSYLKIQESSDSCDSETTVTSHPSQDVATPLALDQPAFDLPDGCEDVERPAGEDGVSKEEDVPKDSSEQIPQYTAHHLPRSTPGGEVTDPDSKPETDQSLSAVVQDSQELEGSQDPSSELQLTQNLPETAADTSLPTEGVSAEDKPEEDGSGSLCPVAPLSPVLSALNRAKQNHLSRKGQQVDLQSSESLQTPGGGGGRGRRGTIPLQRSSSLPSSLLSPSRVVSSVRIQFGQGHASCTQPRYSFKYTHEDGEEEEDEEEKEEEEERPNICLSTLLINPASSSGSNKKPTTAIPPKPIPRYLMRSSYSLQSSSPPPDWPPGGHAHSWSTQSVPDLSSNQQQQQQNLSANQNQQGWNPDQMMYPNPNRSAPSPNPSPTFNSSPYPFNLQYPSTLHPYASLPNLLHHHNPYLNHHSSLTSLHHPATPPVLPHGSLSNLHQASAPAAPHHVGLCHSHPGSPPVPLQGFTHPYSHPSPYHPTPHGPQFASPYLGYPGYNMNPQPAFPHPVPHYPPLAPEHSLHPGLAPAAPGFSPELMPAHAAASGPSSTEMQLRRVLNEIKGTVQSLNQNRANTPDAFSDHRGGLPNHQSLTEFQQKRRSLNLFRSQMTDLELSIIRQQALVYKHLSPADRLEVEQLQSLRSAVREELQELEQQLEDRLIELTHNTRRRGLHRGGSVDSLSTNSALRAMEPVSDLLREQLFLQSELSYGGRTPSSNPSSRDSSPVRGRGGGGGGGGDGEQKQGVYRASINITPVPPPRPVTLVEEEEEEEGERDSGGVEENRGGGRGGGGGEAPVVEGAAREVKVDNLQQLIREIRESVAQEVRREIYSELMAAVVPRQHPL